MISDYQRLSTASSDRTSKSSSIESVSRGYPNSKLCLICGLCFMKNKLPSHQRSCIKRFQTFEEFDSEEGSYPCVNCTKSYNSLELSRHLKVCGKKHFDSHYEPKYQPKIATQPSRRDSASSTINTVTKVLSRKLIVSRHSTDNNPAPKDSRIPIFDEDQEMTSSVLVKEMTVNETRIQKKRQTMGSRQSSISEKDSLLYKHEGKSRPSSEKSERQGPEMVFKNDDAERIECFNCGRKFNSEAFERHERICQNVSKKTRPVFDSSKSRIKGTDIEQFKLKKSTLTEEPKKRKKGAKISERSTSRDHHQQHPGIAEDELVECEFCNRKFSENAAERHIPICKVNNERNQFARISKNDTQTKGKEKLMKRINFQPTLSRKSLEDDSDDHADKGNSSHNLIPKNKSQIPILSSKLEENKIKEKCFTCGAAYLTEKAKFCIECGEKKKKMKNKL